MKKEVNGLNLDRVAYDVAKRIKAMINDDNVNLLCDRSYNVKLGARPAMTAIHEFIDDMVLSYAENATKNIESTINRRNQYA